MIDHISLGVNDIKRARAFYDSVLGTLGYKRLFDDEELASGYGADRPVFWICAPGNGAASAGQGTHVAFAAKKRTDIHAFHKCAVESGGRDDGPPGPRPAYHEHYYAAFVYDPDGNKIEAVKQQPE